MVKDTSEGQRHQVSSDSLSSMRQATKCTFLETEHLVLWNLFGGFSRSGIRTRANYPSPPLKRSPSILRYTNSAQCFAMERELASSSSFSSSACLTSYGARNGDGLIRGARVRQRKGEGNSRRDVEREPMRLSREDEAGGRPHYPAASDPHPSSAPCPTTTSRRPASPPSGNQHTRKPEYGERMRERTAI
ncbi:hypothetical protein ALC56_14806 [Trachymyrmex septentrionalis]|uniref:Uncharacterized protein n=1 Tax=Trachymyrmex septentrionalis TaxID=34720 RepID=A0A195ESY4_9HYME|nr:hypothetical protein ALC56_14806 [Trachymyrmex septentrionalis]